MSHDTAHAHTASHDHGHTSWKPYAATLAALLVLTIITVVAAGINFGSSTVNVVIALGIATVKATLVALYFMHLKYDKPINAVIAAAGFLFLGLFLIFCMTDIDYRENLRPGTEKELPKAAAPAPAPAPAHH